MFAIVTIAGQQFKVEEEQELFVHQLEATEGDEYRDLIKYTSLTTMVMSK
jgi:ribosomal protein L21